MTTASANVIRCAFYVGICIWTGSSLHVRLRASRE